MGFVNDSICKESMKSKRLSQKGYRCSQKELDESSPYSFVAKEEKAGKKLLAGLSSLYFMKTEKTLRCRNKRAWLKLQHGSSWKTTYMTTLNSPLTSSLMKSTKTRKPLSRDKTVFPILWGSWEN